MKKILATGIGLLLAMGSITVVSAAGSSDLIPGKADQAPKELRQTAFVRGDASSRSKPAAVSAGAKGKAAADGFSTDVPQTGALIMKRSAAGKVLIAHDGDVPSMPEAKQ